MNSISYKEVEQHDFIYKLIQLSGQQTFSHVVSVKFGDVNISIHNTKEQQDVEAPYIDDGVPF
jgi:hypothetical protein